MTHILIIKPAVSETLRFRIKKLIEEVGYTYHSGYTNPLGDTCNEIVFSMQPKEKTLPASPNPIMKFFEYEHLPEKLQLVSQPFNKLAHFIDMFFPNSAEKSAGLRKLLEAKDCIVRAAL